MQHKHQRRMLADSLMELAEIDKDGCPIHKSEEALKELNEKSLKDIQIETAQKWADRAEEAYKKAIDEKSIKWLLEADEYFHESIEHSSLSENLSTFEKIRAKLMPIRKKAFKLLAPGSDS